jgi:urease accessory protein
MTVSRPRLQRASGQCRVAFAWRDGQTRLIDLYQRDPCRVLFPDPEPGEPPQAVLVTTSGGVTGGDTLAMAIEVGPGASAVAATQAAEKIYRAAGADHCTMDIAVTVGEAATLDWLPQETILFQGARLKRRTMADVAAGGSLLACEMVVLGRAASGERFTTGLLLDSWSVRRAGKLAWTDALRVEDETPAGAGFGAANALATIIGVWDEPQPRLEQARALLDSVDVVRAGVTLVNGVMVARMLGAATAVRSAMTSFLGHFRRHRLPRVWHI